MMERTSGYSSVRCIRAIKFSLSSKVTVLFDMLFIPAALLFKTLKTFSPTFCFLLRSHREQNKTKSVMLQRYRHTRVREDRKPDKVGSLSSWVQAFKTLHEDLHVPDNFSISLCEESRRIKPRCKVDDSLNAQLDKLIHRYFSRFGIPRLSNG